MQETATLLSGMRAIDEIVAKTMAISDMAQIAKSEVRLRTVYIVEWEKRADKAASAAGKALAAGKSAKQITSSVDKIMGRWAASVETTLADEMEVSYKLAREAGWKTATKRSKAELVYNTPHVEEVKKAVEFSALPKFDLVDKEVVEALEKQQLLWTGRHYAKNVSKSIAKTVKSTMALEGMGRREAGVFMAAAMKKELKRVHVPGGFIGTSRQYFEGLAANSITVARAHGNMRSYMDAGVTKYEIINPSDERTCPVCSHMNGKVFTIKQGADQMHNELKASTPGEVKAAHPWYTEKQLKTISPSAGAQKGAAAGKDSSALASKGYSLPPFHFRCRCGTNVSEKIGSWDAGTAITPPTPKKAPIPIPKPLPGVGNPLGLRQAATYDYAKHEVKGRLASAIPTGDFKPRALQKALTKSAAGVDKLNNSVRVRKEMNNLLAEYGMVSRDFTMNKSKGWAFRVREEFGEFGKSANVRGFYESAIGRITMKRDRVENAAFFLGGGRGGFSTSGMKTLVHESLHAHSPLMKGSYTHAGLVLEEATTELAAKQIMMDKFGVSKKRLVVSYSHYIEHVKLSTKRALATDIAEEQLDDLVMKASLTARRTAKNFSNPLDFLDHYSDELAKHAGLKKTKVAAFKKKFETNFLKPVKKGAY